MEKQIFTVKMLSENNYGLYLIKDSDYTKEFTQEKASYLATVCFKMVWQQHRELRGKKFGTCDFLTDGWCNFIGTEEDFVNFLNNSEDSYRIMTKEELIFLLEYKSNQKQLFYK